MPTPFWANGISVKSAKQSHRNPLVLTKNDLRGAHCIPINPFRFDTFSTSPLNPLVKPDNYLA